MKSRLALFSLAALVLCFGDPRPVCALVTDPDRKIDLPLKEWLAGGEQKNFKGKLKIQAPFLTFQQRRRIRVFATYDLRHMQKSGIQRDLHYVLKIGDGNGNWFPGESYVETKLDAQVKANSDLEIISEANVLPGRYRLAAIMYDTVHKQRSVLFAVVDVPAIKNDPLPEAERDLPRVEFLPEFDRNVSQFGIGKLYLPLQNHRSLHIDLIFDVGAQWLHGNPGFASLTASRQVQVVNAIADLKLQSGCVRLTAIDLLRQELLFERIDARTVNWFKMRSEILKRNLHTIGVDRLDAQRQVAPFVKAQVEKILATAPGCGAARGLPPKRVVIILTSGVLFPPRTKTAKVVSTPACACEVFYIRVAQVLPFDDIPGVLKELDPRKIRAEDPRKFRKELRQLMTELEQISRR